MLFPVAAALAVLALSLTLRERSEAHGDQDQYLTGDPGCLAAVLRATAPSSGVLRQEFVPSSLGTGLQSVDVCLNIPTTSNIIMNIRSGTVGSPGPLLGSASATGVLSGDRWVHFELPSFIPMTSGSPYLIELTGFPLFHWRGTCGQVAGACTSVDSDLYPPGVASASPSVLDFAFRTFSSTDADEDLVADPIDNCVNDANPGQENNDRNFVDQSPPYSTDDATWINSDTPGDACDGDDDNDGLTDAEEESLPGAACPSASVATDPFNRDSDGDRFLDGPECDLGADPADAASKPAITACGSTNDSDADRLSDRIETCFYNTNILSNDTDGDRTMDGAKDGCEAASINMDRAVNAGDQLLLSQEILRTPPPPKLVNMDLNKDGGVNAGDQLFMAFFISPPGQCP
jgi:hypothetical protein